jgi:hypothetical protein
MSSLSPARCSPIFFHTIFTAKKRHTTASSVPSIIIDDLDFEDNSMVFLISINAY